MKSILGTILMGLSPFFAAGAFLAVLKLIEIWNKRKYQRTVDRRNARQQLYGIKPFRGTKALSGKALEEWLR